MTLIFVVGLPETMHPHLKSVEVQTWQLVAVHMQTQSTGLGALIQVLSLIVANHEGIEAFLIAETVVHQLKFFQSI